MEGTSRKLVTSISTDCVAASKAVVDFETAVSTATQDACRSNTGSRWVFGFALTKSVDKWPRVRSTCLHWSCLDFVLFRCSIGVRMSCRVAERRKKGRL
jgi:hypothetical protein